MEESLGDKAAQLLTVPNVSPGGDKRSEEYSNGNHSQPGLECSQGETDRLNRAIADRAPAFRGAL